METGTTQEIMSVAFINDKTPIIDAMCDELKDLGIEILFRSKNIENALSRLSALKELPKVCIVDLDFYNQDIVQQLHEISKQYPLLKLIAHSDIDDEKVYMTLLDIGFSRGLLIGSDVEDFRKAIENVIIDNIL